MAAGCGRCRGAAASALAQVKPEILVKQRQAAMTLQGKYFGPMAGMAQRQAFPTTPRSCSAMPGYLDNLSAACPGTASTPRTKDVKSAALPAIWTEPAKSGEAADRLQSRGGRSSYAVSRSGDEAAVKAQIGAVGKACGACHESFRAEAVVD